MRGHHLIIDTGRPVIDDGGDEDLRGGLRLSGGPEYGNISKCLKKMTIFLSIMSAFLKIFEFSFAQSQHHAPWNGKAEALGSLTKA
jgi:hypothetical protein